MVKEATLTKYGCGEKSSWLEALLESGEAGRRLLGDVRPRNDSGHHHKHAPPSPLVILQPAPTLSHLRLVFTSSLSHVKVGEYYIDVLMEENVLSSSSSISTLSRTSPNCSRRMSDGKQEESKQQQALLNDRLLSPPNNWKPHQQHRISTPCEESMIVLKLMKRIDASDDCSAISSRASLSPSTFRTRKHPLLHRQPERLSSTTIQRTAAGRESSEQFAEHAEFELLVIDYCVKICTTSFVLIYTLIHSSKLACSPSKTRTASRCLMTPSRPICSAAEDPIPVPLVSISRIESALSHPISFPKAHCVIVSLGSLIPLFASNQIFPLDRPSLVPVPKPDQPLQPLRHNEGQLRCAEPSLQGVPARHAPLSLASLLRPDESHSHPHRQVEHFCFISRRTRRCQDGDVGPDQANVAVRREKHAREKKWNELASFHSQNRHSRHCGRKSQLTSKPRASLYLHLNTAIKLEAETAQQLLQHAERGGQVECDQNVGRCGLRRDEVQRRASVVVHPFVPQQHTRFARKPDHPHKEETTENATDEELDTPSPSSAMDDHKSESPHLKQTPTISPSISTQTTTPPAPSTPGTFPRLGSRPVSQRVLAISSLSRPVFTARSSSFTLQDTPTPFSDSVPSEARNKRLTSQLNFKTKKLTKL
ncbi:hypothetical protein BLNAU_21596 [Blattamonas nauphoetae]|uniref:Uncharacterized protein n=1 Tax=Blattamonas nauphoetae TaxID=2049346 RepID=A0ABQ9WVF8_9EUKA|nr:hypothetical protein BLNAU_21596 [Blattamonas nauphoetae]